MSRPAPRFLICGTASFQPLLLSMPRAQSILFSLLLLTCLPADVSAQKKKAVPEPLPPLASPMEQTLVLEDAAKHLDFPVAMLDASQRPWVAYIEHDGDSDSLKLARQTGDSIRETATISTDGIIHQPAMAVTPRGRVWCFWGQVGSRDIVTLRARDFFEGKLGPEMTVAESEGSETFADAAVDSRGRVWVVWQSMRRGQADVFARWLDPSTNLWSAEIAVSSPLGGNWEPRIAIDEADEAWVVFDSSRGGEFNLFLAHVTRHGKVDEVQITNSPHYEARARIAASPDRKKLWISAERGRSNWGRPVRGHQGTDGLNGQKKLLLGSFDIATKSFTEIEIPQNGRPSPRPALSVNLPNVAFDGTGKLWMAWRFFTQSHWRIAVANYDPTKDRWSNPQEIPDSAFGQDRHCALLAAGNRMTVCWPSDNREFKAVQLSRVYLGTLLAQSPDFVPRNLRVLEAKNDPLLERETPSRPRDEHHTWKVGGKTYRLVWGDLHRHTDFSNCRTGHDGCVLEHFRYAFDIAALDFMGTSDHTDIGKRYDPYEWWQTQRNVDVFFAPGKFHSLYAYEREQQFPWGHRNIVFPERGGPIVYLSRKLYGSSPWNARYPMDPGAVNPQILPNELWRILNRYGKPVAVISHTGATAMGTDWEQYDTIDSNLETLVEIFQGARVSYEGKGTPQPTVGLRKTQAYNADVGVPNFRIPSPPESIEDFSESRNNGLYQHALAKGHKLGVFASSDHIAQHTSFGGAYVEENSRMGIIRAFQARATVAATDKIFVEFSCNNHPMGEIITVQGKPLINFAVKGTATIKRITLVRNETDYRTFEPGAKTFTKQFTDESPLAGENRYYLRVEQTDGNMAWSSPVWVTVSP